MSEQNLILLTNADPRSMLLSLLSRRTLEADSRDSYGFAVRPQHLQRYREYGNIYKEEEDERSEKWTNFLQQCSESVQSCKPADEHDETAETNAATGGTEGGESGGENCTSISEKEVGVEKVVPLTKETKRHNIKTWASLRPSLAPIDTMMSTRVKNKACMPNDPAFHGKRLPPSTNKKTSTKQNLDNNLGIPLPSNDITSKSSHIDLEKFKNVAKSKCASDACPDSSVCNTEGQETRIPSNISQSDALQNSSYEDNATSADGMGNTVDNLVTVEPYFPWKEELESLVHGGVPKSLRGEVWQAFVGVRARRIEKYYQKMLSPEPDSSDSKYLSGIASNGFSACTPEKLRKQIEKDLPRTFPGHPALDEEGRNSLRRILMAYARHNPSVGYCQAMNFFAGLFLLLMPEENAFWMLVGIIDDYFDGYYTHEMIESQVDQLVFEELMRERFPKLVNHLDYLGVEVAWVSGPWFLSIFMNMIPWESVLRVWDVLLYEGNRLMLFRTALALMELYGPALVTTQDAADAVSLLQSLTGSTFDSSQLVFTACMGFLSVTEARLEELREKHRPSVLAITEERTKGSEVSKESKSLARVATKLYSFKQDAQSLLKEPDITEGLCGEKIDSMRSEANSSPDNFDEFMHALSNDTEIDSSQDHPEQVVWLKVELCRLMEDKRVATLRAEELETAFLEMVKQDNRRELSAKVEHLEQEVSALRQALADKHEQEQAMLQVLMRVEQEQKVAEDARIAAEREVAVQKNTVHVLQGKYKKAMASIAEMEKRVVMAESMLQATLQYESGQAKALSSPRSTPSESPGGSRRTGLLSFGLGWRDKNKGKTTPEEQQGENRLIGHNSDD